MSRYDDLDPPFNWRGLLGRATTIACMTGFGALLRYTLGPDSAPWTHSAQITAGYCVVMFLLDGASRPRS